MREFISRHSCQGSMNIFLEISVKNKLEDIGILCA